MSLLCSSNAGSFYLSRTMHGWRFLWSNFLKNSFGEHGSFLWGPLIPLFWISGDICPGFHTQCGSVDPLACLLCHSHATESSDSPLVQHLLISWQPVWLPNSSHPHTCKQALVGLKTGIYHAALQCETRQTLYRLSYTNLVFRRR